MTNEVAVFNCKKCGTTLKAPIASSSKLVPCPICMTTVPVPASSPGVPIQMGLRGLGKFITTVSRNDAGRLGHTFMGGMLVALGVTLGAAFGIRFPKG